MFKNKFVLSLMIMVCFFITGCGAKTGIKKKDTRLSIVKTGPIVREILPPMGRLTPGEKLSFKISWLGINVGRSTLMVKDAGIIEGQEAALVELKAQSTGFFRFIYKVDGTIQSYVNMKTFKPIKYISETRINKRFIAKQMKYDFKENKVYAKDRKGEYVVDINEKILDPLGVFHYFRKNEVVLNQPIDLFINSGKKNFTVRVYAQRQKVFKVPAGSFWAFQVEPTRESERQFDDALNAEGSMRIWFSADERRLPLFIALKVPVGSAVATLMKIEHVESELTQN